MDPLDMEKPEVKEGETLCEGCWKVEVKPALWVWLRFTKVKCVWICPACQPKFGPDLEELQRLGL